MRRTYCARYLTAFSPVPAQSTEAFQSTFTSVQNKTVSISPASIQALLRTVRRLIASGLAGKINRGSLGCSELSPTDQLEAIRCGSFSS